MNIQDYLHSYKSRRELEQVAKKIFRDRELSLQLQAVYKDTFGETLSLTCENCVSDAVFRLVRNTNQTDKKMEKAKGLFRLKGNPTLWIGVWGIHITNNNLTDEVGFDLLKKFGEKILSKFEKYPENWKELIGEKADKKIVSEVKIDKIDLDSTGEIPTIEELTKLKKQELIQKVKDYPNPVVFSEDWNKDQIAQALIDRMVIDA